MSPVQGGRRKLALRWQARRTPIATIAAAASDFGNPDRSGMTIRDPRLRLRTLLVAVVVIAVSTAGVVKWRHPIRHFVSGLPTMPASRSTSASPRPRPRRARSIGGRLLSTSTRGAGTSVRCEGCGSGPG